MKGIEETPVYTVPEVAQMLKLSRPAVTAMFEKESGIIVIERPEKMNKRRYRTIRIPRAVYLRVIGRMVKAMRKMAR